MPNPSLDISVLVEDPAWAAKLPRLQKHINAIINATLNTQNKVKLKHDSYEISLVFTNDRKIKKLNRDHRGKDYATNVLSFPMDTAPAAPGLPVMLGDIVITLGLTETEAKAAKKPFDHHVLHLICHSTLHLCGYDHITPGQARTMERLEKEILKGFNIPDPYTAPPRRTPGSSS
jgi:probable rRNA maturation factor